MLVSVAICTYQRYDLLAECLASVRQQNFPTDAREILVLDNSPDAALSRRVALDHAGFAGLRWHHLDRPGVAFARNQAMLLAGSPLVAFVDDDVTVGPGWLAAIVDGFARFGEAAHSVGGPVRPDWPAPPPAWLAEGMLPFLSLVDRGATPRLLEPTEWIATANAAFRRDRLLAAGGFREDLGRRGPEAMLLSGEDTELVDRLHRAGGRTAWQPAAMVYHRIDPGRLDRSWFRRRFAWQAVADFMVQPAHQLAAGRPGLEEAERYLAHVGLPGLAGLAEAQDRPDLCHWQMSAVYHLVLALLGGLREPGAHG